LRSIIHPVLLAIMGLCASPQVIRAQEVAAYFGLGTTYVSSNGTKIDTFGDGSLYKTPAMDGLFASLGASVFFTKRFGAGAELSWRPSEGDYAGLKYRPSFASFDGILRPSFGSTEAARARTPRGDRVDALAVRL